MSGQHVSIYSLLFLQPPRGSPLCFRFFFFNDTATTEIYTLSLHDALPISGRDRHVLLLLSPDRRQRLLGPDMQIRDRKSTRLNSSHQIISYAVFCLKKKKKYQDSLDKPHRHPTPQPPPHPHLHPHTSPLPP